MAAHDADSSSPFSLRAFITAFVAVAVVVVVVVVAAYRTCGFEGCPDIEEVGSYAPDEATLVVDRDGEEVGRLFDVHRVVVPLDSLPEHVTRAVLAIEDQEFYHHGGVDWTRALGALWQNLRSAGIEEGFSTITMQVARNVFPDRLPAAQRTLNRKISEIRVARALEDRYSKDEILSLYLNQIYFGSGAWGIEAAAREYFGTSATDLTLGQATLLAGLPQAPSRLDPHKNMAGALERRETVLRRMVDQGFITREQADEVLATEPELAGPSAEGSDRAAYFMEHVRQLVEDSLGDAIYTQGYTVHTTLDLDVQQVVSRELENQLEAIEAGRFGPYPRAPYPGDTTSGGGETTPYLQGAVLTMDVRTGDVLAMVGGRDFDQSKFNRALQARRQPGSAFKPFVYAAALQYGFPPSTILQDTPYVAVRDGREWAPSNYGGSYSGPITMRDALRRSKNVATIRLAEQVGLDRVIHMARQLGITGDIPRYPSIAIGAAEVTLGDMVFAYAALAALGDRPQPRYVTRVTDRTGNLIWRVAPENRHVLASDVAFVTVDLMRDVVDRGTGTAVRSAGFTGPAAGKTGTTNEAADVWFIGFTPRIVTGVWIGMDEPRSIMGRATGGRLAAPVWGRIMARVDEGSGGWDVPPGVERYRVDAGGNVVGSDCPGTDDLRLEYFIRGTARPYGCREYLYGFSDSLGIDSLRGETDSWWSRVRGRLFGEDDDFDRDRRDSITADTSIRGERGTIILEKPDTVGQGPIMGPVPPDTLPRPRPRDSLLEADPPADTVRPDTMPPGAPPTRSAGDIGPVPLTAGGNPDGPTGL